MVPLVTALYLAHLSPLTSAHAGIISDLIKEADTVKVMPVVFKDGDREINSRSFPFSYTARKEMLHSEFGDSILVTDDYTFFAPFKRYVPPLLAPKSWELRRQVLRGVSGDFFSYTGDRAEAAMLMMYRLHPRRGKRRPLSATSVKEVIYEEALGGESAWTGDVPPGTARVIRGEWDTVKRFASLQDHTTKIAGMKFPKEGWSQGMKID